MNAASHERDTGKTSTTCAPVRLGVRAMVTAIIIVVIPAMLFFCCPGKAGAEQEYLIKAAFLYNFAKFIVWPSAVFGDATIPLGICVIGRNRFGNALGTLKNKTVEGKPIVVRKSEKAEDIDRCHILFISASEKENLPQILKAIRGTPVLTVGDTDGFARSGVMINLVPIGNRIGFEINLTAVEETPLKISSKLLKLGKTIR
ncbi:MAG: hypothetical protein A4E62_01440 [Syntrophorhabdus sp. PtaU1.Bin002]|nr:MAG: hypothetical protein A4E58_03042 [Syntrophorhabdus sp. PtaB.Bin006]OPY71158.1 MAG: hypothetical protein A4E62_01440 [Syntrophorhabdus sp. PtaU1.Bin002]